MSTEQFSFRDVNVSVLLYFFLFVTFVMQLVWYLVSGELEMRSRSQPVQRDLPRPVEVNMAVLRPPHTDPPLTELQKVSWSTVFDVEAVF